MSSFHSASLYVGDLSEKVDEDTLYRVFQEVGPILSVRVLRDVNTKNSLGYAYVNFQNPEDAERALDNLNFTLLQDRPMRIMWCQRDPSIRKSGVGNIFIKNLDSSIDNKALYDTFSTFGNILSCSVKEKNEITKVKNEETGVVEDIPVTKGYGFVHFETQQAADNAIQKMNGMVLNGKKVFVGPHQKKQERFGTQNAEKDFTNIYIKDLDPTATTEELLELFGKYGKIQHGEVMFNHEGKSKEFAFINYENHDDAVKAVQEMHGKEFKGKNLFVSRAQTRQERQTEMKEKSAKAQADNASKWEGQNLYVKNLDDTFDEDKLKAEFAKYGEISSAKIMRDEKNKSKGFGFVCFASPEEATRALTDMNGKMVGSKPLYVSLAQKKDVRRAQLQAQHQRHGGPMMPMGMPVPYGQPMFFPGPPGGPMPRGAFPPMAMRPRWSGHPVQPMARPFPGQPPMGAFPPVQGAPLMQGAPVRGRGGRGGRGGKVRYNQNVRNQRPIEEQQAGQPLPDQVAQAAPIQVAQLTLSNLASLPQDEQKRILGEQLYPMIYGLAGEEAGKITGMLLEMDNTDILECIKNPQALDSKVNEALAVLQQHSTDAGEQ